MTHSLIFVACKDLVTVTRKSSTANNVILTVVRLYSQRICFSALTHLITITVHPPAPRPFIPQSHLTLTHEDEQDVTKDVEIGLRDPRQPDNRPDIPIPRIANMKHGMTERAQSDEVLWRVIRVVIIDVMGLESA